MCLKHHSCYEKALAANRHSPPHLSTPFFLSDSVCGFAFMLLQSDDDLVLDRACKAVRVLADYFPEECCHQGILETLVAFVRNRPKEQVQMHALEGLSILSRNSLCQVKDKSECLLNGWIDGSIHSFIHSFFFETKT